VQLKNVLFAPLTVESRTVGVIGLANKIGEFTQRDAEMAMAFGEVASVALANSQILEILEENEKELRMHSEHLETLVEERTRDLKNSERLAAIGATAGMVGHDIRNPLQAITSDVYLAKTDLESIPESSDKNNALESLSEIEKNVSYINKIVQDLQDYAKPISVKLEETDLEQIVQVVLAALVIPENITVTYSIRKDFPKLKTDPSYIQRILTNLSNNGVQAMPKGGKLTIAAFSKKGKAAIIVQDTGEGIPESVRNKIFTPLVTTKAKGQGFGLSVVKRFTEAMGGTVTFESEVGKGTKFIIELPL
jgi:signal transduction histidine kinase